MENNKLKLDYLKRILTDSLSEKDYHLFFSHGYPSTEQMEKCINFPISPERNEGLDWPQRAHTMIGLKRLNNLHDMMDYVRENKIEGDFVETGVWRGGATIFMKAYINIYELDKIVFVCDSFEGLPEPDVKKYPFDKGDTHHTFDYLKISLESVKNNFSLYNLLDDRVKFIKGWFSDTLPNNKEIQEISILRFDGDMYGSTIDVLESLYSNLSDNGVIIIDDYCLPNCAKAVTDFRISRNITEEMLVVDRCGRFWFKKIDRKLINDIRERI